MKSNRNLPEFSPSRRCKTTKALGTRSRIRPGQRKLFHFRNARNWKADGITWINTAERQVDTTTIVRRFNSRLVTGEKRRTHQCPCDTGKKNTHRNKMPVSDEEKRWMVVGISLHKVLPPTLRKCVKDGLDNHYTTLNKKYNLKTLTHGHCVCTCKTKCKPPTCKPVHGHCVCTPPTCKPTCKPEDLLYLKYENIHNNATHGQKKTEKLKYNYNINNAVDLAKLYLPEYMTGFSGFDDSLEMGAMLWLLGKPSIFHSPTKSAADDVRKNVRNKWGHPINLETEWTQAFYDDCFVKLENLVRSLGLGSNEEKQLNDELKDWQTKGCHMCMGQIVDRDLLLLVQQEVGHISQQCDKVLYQEFPDLKKKMDGMMNRLKQVEDNVQEQGKKVERMEEKMEEHEQKVQGRIEEREQKVQGRMDEHEQKVEGRMEEREQKVQGRVDEHEQKVQGRMDEHEQKVEGRMEECEQKVEGRIEEHEQKVEGRMDEHEQKVEERMDEHEQKVEGRMEEHEKQVKCEVEEIKQNVERATHRRKGTEEFDLHKFRDQLNNFYQVTMSRIQRTPWDADDTEDIDNVYTRLSWCREDKKPSGTQEEPLNDYTDIFGGQKNHKRIVVKGEAGIGKSAFSQRLAIDWVRREKEALKKFDILLAIKLRDVHDNRNFEDILTRTGIVQAGVDPAQVLQYINEHQDRVLILLDGYDEYDRELSHDDTSDVYKIITGRMLAGCHLVVTTRPQRVDEVKKYMQAEYTIRGFTEEDMTTFASKHVEREEVDKLMDYLKSHKILDMAKFPLLLLFLCLLWNERKEEALPTSRTELYEKVVKSIVDRWLRVKCPTQENTGKVDEMLCKIGKVAFEALVQGSLVFEARKLSGVLTNDDVQSLGIFSAWKVTSSCPKMMVSFIHKSMQEFLAAMYIAKKIIPSGTTEWLSRFGDFSIAQGFFDFFVFVCGLSTEGAVAVFQHLKNIRVEDLPSGKDFESLADFEETSEQGNFLRWCFRLFTSVNGKESITGTFLECVDGVVLTYDDIHDDKSADPSVLQKLFVHDSLAVLMITGSSLNEPSLLSTLNRFDIKVVNSSGVSCMTKFAEGCLLIKQGLWILKQGQVNPTPKKSVFYIGFRDLFIRGSLQYLELRGLLQVSPSSEQSETATEEEQSDTSGNSAQFHCFLVTKSVVIGHIFVMDNGIFHELMFAKNLTKIRLLDHDISQEAGPVHLARFLDNATLLRLIDISRNPLGPGVSVVACCLKNLPNLKCLALSSTNMTEKEAVDLANNLQYVPLLTELHLSNNAIGRGLIPLAKNLIHLPRLQNLQLRNTGGDDECRAALEKAQEDRETKIPINYSRSSVHRSQPARR